MGSKSCDALRSTLCFLSAGDSRFKILPCLIGFLRGNLSVVVGCVPLIGARGERSSFYPTGILQEHRHLPALLGALARLREGQGPAQGCMPASRAAAEVQGVRWERGERSPQTRSRLNKPRRRPLGEEQVLGSRGEKTLPGKQSGASGSRLYR